MKNPVLLKDELRLLNQDKSGLVKELDKVVEELKKRNEELVDTNAKLRGSKSELQTTFSTARVLASETTEAEIKLHKLKNELDGVRNKLNEEKIIAAQEINLLTARIAECKAVLKETEINIELLRQTYDNNTRVYTQHLAEKSLILRKLDDTIVQKEERIVKLDDDIDVRIKEKGFLLEEMKSKEEIFKVKEQTLDLLVKSNEIKQKDLINSSRDLIIVYQRLKELYAIVDPKLDVDRLFSKLLKQ